MKSVIKVSGTPYEQGKQEGGQLREVIAANVIRVKEKVDGDHLNMEKYRDFVSKNLLFIKESHHDLYEEMQGIAEGSGISFEDIVLLNIPAYFMKDYFNQECSMLLVRGKATLDGKTYVIKNRDMGMYLEQAVIHREYTDGLKMVEISGAGTVTYPACGMNSYGLGVTNTGFWSAKAPSDVERVNSAHIFLNSHILLTNCRTAKEALEFLKKTPRMNGLNVIIADAKDAFCVEMTKNDVNIEEDTGRGVLFRTNHYISDKFSRLNPDITMYTSTFSRYDRIREMVEERYGALRFQDLFRIMSDHENGVNSICRHPGEGYPAKTVSTSMFVVEDFEAWATIGNPCENLRFSSLI